MTIREFIALVEEQGVDLDTTLVCTPAPDGELYSPCPAESGPGEFGPFLPYVDEQGDFHEPPPEEEVPRKVYFLAPHDANNPHD